MDQGQKAEPRLNALPREAIDWFVGPLGRFLRIEAAGGVVLLLSAILAFALSNSALAERFLAFWDTPLGVRAGAIVFERSLRGWINDGLMTLFFFVVALELKRELVLGELREPRVAALSIAAAAGGMLVPAGIYLASQFGRPGEHGWGTVMATDTAFVIGCLALLGRNAPQRLRIFLLSLAVVDDIGAILVVAAGYSGTLDWTALTAGGAGIAAVRGLALLGVRTVPVYIVAGSLIWIAIDASGIHPTVAGVVLGLLTPTRGWVSDRRLRAILQRVLAYPPGDHWSGDTADRRVLRSAGKAAQETLSPVERLGMALHPWVAFGVMPLFALANAGVPLSIDGLAEPLALTVMIGLVLGKPVGVVGFAWLAVRSGMAVRPKTLGWGMLAGGGILAGIGFTMALLIAELAFQGGQLQAAKLGILAASVISAATGLAFLALLGRHGRTPVLVSGG
ncbi:Na+/H+ antiporter NhaA [Neoroseomonas oryzicola]|uniref:Na(+)/H(+) antiporter NhaA n=2 Tax=Neoroseomonas oryzicola TaxID=535904 RepID=A0A9X9WPE6_9PROT|nr:Na+/H+ antiporter NhaA [Neoroseomonas oryzicola]MBR0662206.1 Na+/H+ antiporter NhaA [Neoroseomonas oryzicola]NKE20227.1 Na+/H+ antiporter NhaA [Neoroseomonas oryzicola]